jgi:hypothetical protein
LWRARRSPLRLGPGALLRFYAGKAAREGAGQDREEELLVGGFGARVPPEQSRFSPPRGRAEGALAFQERVRRA